MTRWLPACVVFSLISVPVWAQTCLGYGPIDQQHPVNINFGTAFSTGLNTVHLGVGGGRSAFGNGGVDVNDYPDLEATTYTLTGIVGTQVTTDAHNRGSICPIGYVAYENADGVVGSDASLRSFRSFGGVAYGLIAAESATVQIVPSAGLVFGGETVWGKGPGGSLSIGDAYGVMRVALGITLKQLYTITPEVRRDFGSEGGNGHEFLVTFTFTHHTTP